MALLAITFAAGIWDAASGSTLARLIPTLFLLGLAWSCTMIAGSALVAETVEGEMRLAFQGTVDTVMNLGAGLVTATTGTVLALWGFVGIYLLASAVLVLLVLVALRASRRG